jgi:3-oxoacyl-[acyl-carrier protein] reductase
MTLPNGEFCVTRPCSMTDGFSMPGKSQPLEGKVALVTGAGRGIGRAISQRLAREGAMVVLHYRNSNHEVSGLVREITSAGGVAFSVCADLTSTAQIEQLYKDLDRKLPEITGRHQFDVLVNNAGIGTKGSVGEITPEVFDEVMDTNLRGPFFVTKHAIPRMNAGGSIIFISSLVTRIPLPEYAAYCLTKGALNTLTVLLAVQLRSKNITVNAIAPGPINTDMTASARRLVLRGGGTQAAKDDGGLLRPGQPDDVASVVAFLASTDARWITGECIEASGGLWL